MVLGSDAISLNGCLRRVVFIDNPGSSGNCSSSGYYMMEQIRLHISAFSC
jgi:hypothetical protein